MHPLSCSQVIKIERVICTFIINISVKYDSVMLYVTAIGTKHMTLILGSRVKIY